MSANRRRGEIAAILDGREHRLCLTLGALAELEDAFGADDMTALGERFANGANLCAVKAVNGVWELLQFREAEEVEPSVWHLSYLLRGQLGSDDAMHAGAGPGAAFVVVDGALAKSGLPAELVGLPLNWRIGPAGGDFGGPDFVAITAAGGVRSQLPLAPVHLKATVTETGDVAIKWIRRGRIDADSWVGEDIPLGEELERYRVEVATEAGAILRTIESSAQSALYERAAILADFEDLPATATLTVRQISAAIGAGLPVAIAITIT